MICVITMYRLSYTCVSHFLAWVAGSEGTNSQKLIKYWLK
jgi:hypothetical protein